MRIKSPIIAYLTNGKWLNGVHDMAEKIMFLMYLISFSHFHRLQYWILIRK